MAVDAVVIPEHVFGLTAEGSCLSQLLYDPIHGGIVCRSETFHPPPPVMHDHEDVKEFEVGSSHSEEVHCPGYVDVVVEKYQP